jgi:predicted HAD superfamily Cof-like phosphohydrolase
MQQLEQVSEFQKAFELPILDKPQLINTKRAWLRIGLIEEELNELKEAVNAKDLVEIADALCDLQYVILGAVLEFGMGEKFVEMFNEVHRSNMSKSCNDILEAIETQNHYLANRETQSYIKQVGDKYNVLRLSDDKLLKSINCNPADLGKFV